MMMMHIPDLILAANLLHEASKPSARAATAFYRQHNRDI